MITRQNKHWIVMTLIGLMLVMSAGMYPTLPAEMPVQWGVDGSVTGTAPREIAVLLMPVIAVFVWAMTVLARRIDPRRDQYKKFEKTYRRLRLGIIVFLGFIHVLLLTNYDNPAIMVKLVLLAVCALIVVIGNEITRVEQTWFFGIRTPWTLDDERVWKRTHRVGARWMVAVGIINMVSVLLLPLPWIVPLLIATVLGLSIGLMVYSWWLHSKLNP